MWTATRAQVLRRGIVVALVSVLVSSLGSARVHAGELGDTVWLPHVDPAKGVDETFQVNTLGIIKVGNADDADWRIFRGKYRESVSRRDFFITVGRPDLSDRDSSRRTKRTALLIGGVAGIISGVWVAGARFSEGGWDPPLYLGGGLIAGGFLAYWVSDVFSGPDLPSAEAETLILRYNERLREHLDPTTEPRKHIQVVQLLQLAPWIATQSAGLAIAARF